jgi:hypothetical protein
VMTISASWETLISLGSKSTIQTLCRIHHLE